MTPGRPFILVHRASTLGVAACGFAALGLAGQLDAAGVVTAGLALGASLWSQRPRLSERVWVIVQLAFLAWLAVQWLVLSRHVLGLFGALLVFVQVHRLLTRRGTKDDLTTHFIAFAQLLLASVLTVSFSFFLVFLGFVFCVVQALLFCRMALVVEDQHESLAPGSPVPPAAFAPLDRLARPRTLLATTALAGAIQVGTLLLFFVLPRTQAAMFSGLVPPLHVAGFSDRVRLGSVGVMQLSREPVLRATVTDAQGRPAPGVDQLYWFGLALDRFDGRAWELSDPRRTRLVARGGKRGRPPPSDRPYSIRAEVVLEPLDAGVIFHVPAAVGIYGEIDALDAAETEGFSIPGSAGRRRYTVYSDPRRPEASSLRAQDPRDAPASVRGPYTQLPPGLSPRIAALAEEWTDGASTPLDEVLLVEARLRRFTYSLDQAPSGYPDPLLAFLEDVQEGHCEYFASALAVMLRTQGIPSRIVNGFLGAEWNPVGEYWVVRQLHAHSWVEVWFPDDGWVAFDPTPAGNSGLGEARTSLLSRFRAYRDVAGVRFTQVMLDYGMETQMQGLRRGLGSLAAWVGRDVRLPGLPSASAEARQSRPPWSRWGLLALVFMAGSVLLLWALRPTGPLPRPLRGARHEVLRLEVVLRAAADEASADWLLSDLVARAAQAHPELALGPKLVADYHAARFGGHPLPARTTASLRHLRRAARRLLLAPSRR